MSVGWRITEESSVDIFKWLNDQLLRMDWLHWLVQLLVEDVFGLDMASRLGGSWQSPSRS